MSNKFRHLAFIVFLLSSIALSDKAESIENNFLRIGINGNNELIVHDKVTDVDWRAKLFGFKSKIKVSKSDNSLKLSKDNKNLFLKLTLAGKRIKVFYEGHDNLNLFDITDKDKGYILTPTRMGLLILANSGVAFEQTFPTFDYESLNMQMIGAVKANSALIVCWNDPYISIHLRSKIYNKSVSKYKQKLSFAISSPNLTKSFELIFIGNGDYNTIAKAYRKKAKEIGWLVTMRDKLKNHPEDKKLIGAANVKLWSTLTRIMSEDSREEKNIHLSWTFDEAAQVAEHLKNDLKINKVLFTLGGWINRGYDNRHPDILPAAPECGGNEKLSECAKRVKNLGYLFCLHDNYSDMYLDAPSWNEKYIMRNKKGELIRGGKWAGGRSYLICSEESLMLAKRPNKNLPAVKRLFNPNAYFIDVTFAANLFDCYSKLHPLRKYDDMRYKQKLSDYARGLFGVFGSEDGKEWAIPHADFFEGIAGVKGKYLHKETLASRLGAVEIPFFNMVYHDCISTFGKYSYDINSSADYVLLQISEGNHLNYHAIMGDHLYWKNIKNLRLSISPSVTKFKKLGNRKFEISYKWTIDEKINDNWRVFTHFTGRLGKIMFQNDYAPNPETKKWKKGVVIQGPFTVQIPDNLQGEFDIVTGMFDIETGLRAILNGQKDSLKRCKIGSLVVKNNDIQFIPYIPSKTNNNDAASLFCRADNGWAEGLNTFDIFLKNTDEVLSPLNEITAMTRITKFEYLSCDFNITKTTFGDNKLIAVVNRSKKDFVYIDGNGNKIILPPFGFIIKSPEFIAVHAKQWNGIKYNNPPLFTIRSLDGNPLPTSNEIRIYHGFGDDKIKINNKIIAVKKEKIIKK